MLKSKWYRIFSGAMVFCMLVQEAVFIPQNISASQEGMTELTAEDLAEALGEDVSYDRASVHDPSVVEAKQADGQVEYYVFGSHMAVAKSSDLMNWEQVSAKENDTSSTLFSKSYLEEFENNTYTGEVAVSSTVSETGRAEFGTYNAELYTTGSTDGTGLTGNMWAPDVIYNQSLGKWCMYLSLNGPDNSQQSVIVMLAADNVEGPYEYQGPVVYTRVEEAANSTNYWKNTDMDLIYGDIESMPARYQNSSAGDWANYYPHAIDPSVFYDEEGKLWMVYGSWSGGIYMLELDETTGLRDYTVTYQDADKNNGIDNLTSTKEELGKDISADPYYGTKVAGGYYVSGEGPYIEAIDGKYYLFVSYGEYSPNGNYQMRVFSSNEPDGPYTDTTGASAIYDSFSVNYNATYSNISDTRGSRLMTNYKWSTMDTGEVSQGHNSVIHTDAGDFVIYHTKFDDGSYSHEIRVHQLYTTQNGYLVAAPYEYDSSVTVKTDYSASEATGDYEVIFQNYDTNQRYDEDTKQADTDTNGLECETSVKLQLLSDGTVSDGSTGIGTWSVSGQNLNMTLTAAYAEGKYAGTYEGVLMQQNVGQTEKTCFSVVNGSTGLCIWGSAAADEKQAIALTEKNMKLSIPAKTSKNLTLPVTGLSGATISWSSSNPEILSDEGEVAVVSEDTKVCLTERITCGSYYYEKEYTVTVSSGNASPGSVNIRLGESSALTSLDNPFYGKELNQLYISYTINWDAAAAKNGWDGLFSFYNDETKGRVSIQSAPYLCYNNQAGSWLDVNQPAAAGAVNKALNATAGLDYTYEIVITEDGISMYENGVEFTPSVNTDNGATARTVLDYISDSCDKFSWGIGLGTTGYWNTEICTLKDVVISEQIPQEETIAQEKTLVENTEPETIDNPFYQKEIRSFTAEFMANYASNAALDGWRSLLAFYDDTDEGAVKGRISIQTAPYICYNEMNGTWMDINSPSGGKNTATTLQKGKNYKYKLIVTGDSTRFFLDGEEITGTTEAGSEEADYQKLLNYLSECNKLSFGALVGQTSFWWTENAVLSNIKLTINNVSEVGTGEETAQTYQVTYNMKGHGGQVAAQTVEKGAKLEEPSEVMADGYRFDGWYQDGAYKQVWDFANDTVESNLTLFAKWTKTGTAESPVLLQEFAKSFELDLSIHSDTADGSYLPEYSYDNPWKGIDLESGATIVFHVKEDAANTTNYGALFAVGSEQGKLFFTPGTYLGFNSGGDNGYTDGNKPDGADFTDYLEQGTEKIVTITILPDDVKIYVDGELCYDKAAFADSTGFYGYDGILDFLENADKLYFGYGSFWNTTEYDVVHASISQIKCYQGIAEAEKPQKTKLTYDMSKVKWNTAKFTYDGKEKSVTLTGLPSGVTAVYSGNKATDAGSYKASVTFTYDTENYNAPAAVASCLWTIQKATPSISADKKSYSKTYGDKAFSLSAKTVKGCTFTYSSDKKTVAKVDEKGKVTLTGCGKAVITITASGANYTAKTVKVTITVKPKKETITKLSSSKSGTLSLKWKQDKTATGYQIQYSTSKKFTKSTTKTVEVKKNGTTSLTLQKCKKNHKYYVRILAYKKDSKVTYSGSWSSVKSLTVRK